MDSFLKVCGATSPLRIRVRRQGSRDYDFHSFDQPSVLIGRDALADLRIEHPSVSRRHAYLQVLRGRLLLTDLGSRIGTYIDYRSLTVELCRDESGPMKTSAESSDDQRPHSSCWIEPGEKFRIGPCRFRIIEGVKRSHSSKSTDGHAKRDAEPATELEGLTEVTVEISDEKSPPTQLSIDQEMILGGRSPTCTIHLNDSRVSSYHFSLVRTMEGVWVVDLLGRGGITLNGTGVRFARVYDGDALKVGHSTIRFLFDRDRERNLRTRSLPEPEEPFPVLPWAAPRLPAGLPALPGMMPLPPAPFPWMAAGPPAMSQTPGDLSVNAATGGELAASAWNASIPAPMVQQMWQMQQQMFDQFYSAMMFLFQTFATLQQDQRSTLRQEFNRLSQLSREVCTLQAELAKLEAKKAASSAAASKAAEASSSKASSARKAPSPASGRSTANGDAPAPAEPAPESVSARKTPTESRKPDSTSHEQLHAELCHRLASLQSEQLTRWQKILKLIPGQV
jgi:pSer/pThr/pTyr-binding forkhead associated (FHA) protein